MAWYKEGSITLEQNSKKVIGSGTKWTNPLVGICSGQMLITKTQNTIEIYEIASVQSDTELTLAKHYDGETKSGLGYEIPTVPKVSIEALALRISEMLNYYQQQMEGWQTALTGEGEVTVTAPDGRVVTIKSQYSIQKELIQLVEQSKDFASSANKSSATATEAASIAVTSSNEAYRYADNARDSATASSQSATNSANSAKSANTSEVNAKSAEIAAKNSADNAKEWASTVDSSNFIKKLGDEKQRINGKLDVHELTVNDMHVITDLSSVHNKINALNDRVYVVESYHYGTEWYRVYSDGYIEQSGALIVKTPSANEVCGTLINLLKPMSTQNYGVSIDKIHSGAWGITEFAYAELYQSAFWLASYSNMIDEGWIRWTVRGY